MTKIDHHPGLQAYFEANRAVTYKQVQPAGTYQFVNVNAFTPALGHWTPFGNVASVKQNGNSFLLTAQDNGVSLNLSFLSPTCFRVRFSPDPSATYTTDNSRAVVNRDLGPVTVSVLENTSARLVLDTGTIQLQIALQPYAVQVFRKLGNDLQLVHSDNTATNGNITTPGYNLVYIPGQEVIAYFKTYPAHAHYFGFGEKAGSQLAKNEFTMTFFNFDNFEYASGPLPAGQDSGPLNPSETLYCSVPLLIENNPSPQDGYAGPAYSYGLFFDNTAQSYINIGASDYANMYGMYYYGALYGEIDAYFMLGDNSAQVVDQYTQLTGRPAFPPKFAFGYQQGAYGYYDRYKLEAAANSYRAAEIPIDGLHIDVDFQDNYRTFTSSNMKFPNVQEMFTDLRTIGFKCSTNITALVTNNPLDEYGSSETPYPTRDSGVERGYFLSNARAGIPATSLFVGEENYGVNHGTNPYPYPPLQPDNQGQTQLGSGGYYPDLGRPEVREWWGQQYEYLFSVGLEMVWQDMTCPAIYAYYDTPEMQQAANDQTDFNPPYGEAPPEGETRVISPWKTAPLDLMMSGFDGQTPNAVIHNGYALTLCQATYEGLAKLRPEKRNFIIARGGYAGVQRYAGLWTGDSASSWEFLQINLPEVLNFGLSGIPISGCDIGGFGVGSGSTGAQYFSDGQVFGNITNYELFTRWMQLGSFLPWYRNHYDGYEKQFQEPYMYGEPVPTNCRKYIELRYRMMQIYYDAMYQATQSGMPIARALFLNDPGDAGVYGNNGYWLNTEFMVGPDVLVAPITTPHETSNPSTTPVRDIYLPAGSQWYAFMDNQHPLQGPVEGGYQWNGAPSVTGYYAGLDLVPIYIRAGAILPMRELEQWIGQKAVNPLTINVYPGPNSSYTLYQDDGVSTDYAAQKAYRLTQISHTGITSAASISPVITAPTLRAMIASRRRPSRGVRGSSSGSWMRASTTRMTVSVSMSSCASARGWKTSS